MTFSKKSIAATAILMLICMFSVFTIYAASPIYCKGGGGYDSKEHLVWQVSLPPWYTCTYNSFWHNVDRVLDGHVYSEAGHECGNDYGTPYSTSCVDTIVGYAP